MRISRKSEYALRALVTIAGQPRSFQIQELSRLANIPVKFLEQILLVLRHAGFLTSKRGVGGGYALRVPAAEINIGDIIRLMDGPLAPVPCAAAQPVERCSCPDPRTCPLRLLMIEVREELSAIFDHRTIDDLVKSVPESAALAFEI